MVYQDFVIMNQLTFKFPFSKKYYEQDFFVSTNNFSAFKLIDDWPNWPGKWLNIFGESWIWENASFKNFGKKK